MFVTILDYLRIIHYLYCMENAEELLLLLRGCVEKLDIKKYEPLVSPTMYDPDQLQNDVTIIVMEEVEGGTIPRFKVNVKDLEGIRNWNKVKKYG